MRSFCFSNSRMILATAGRFMRRFIAAMALVAPAMASPMAWVDLSVCGWEESPWAGDREDWRSQPSEGAKGVHPMKSCQGSTSDDELHAVPNCVAQASANRRILQWSPPRPLPASRQACRGAAAPLPHGAALCRTAPLPATARLCAHRYPQRHCLQLALELEELVHSVAVAHQALGHHLDRILRGSGGGGSGSNEAQMRPLQGATCAVHQSAPPLWQLHITAVGGAAQAEAAVLLPTRYAAGVCPAS